VAAESLYEEAEPDEDAEDAAADEPDSPAG